MKSILILGRQPELSLAELESLFGSENIMPFGSHCLCKLAAGEIPFKRIGGTIKTAALLAELPSASWHDIEKYLLANVPEHTTGLPKSKLTLGLSVYGIEVSTANINKTMLNLKRVIKAQGRPIRVVPNKQSELNAAQVLHNQLTYRGAWELIVVSDGRLAYLAQTIFVQDIDAYSARDQARPKRDAVVGMLPPKLAQMIINFSVGSNFSNKPTILDPFCGSGVIIQEALLSGHDAVGTDIDDRMVEFSHQNIEWLGKKNDFAGNLISLYQADATTERWHEIDNRFSIASEIYLGPVLRGRADSRSVQSAKKTVDKLLSAFLINLGAQINSGFRLSLAVPCWQTQKGFERLAVLDRLSVLGYNRLSFVHAGAKELVYHRPGQAVAREIIVLIKK